MGQPLSFGVMVYTTVAKLLLVFVNVPEFKLNGAVTLERPAEAAPVPVTPDGRTTETSNLKFVALLVELVGLEIEKSGVPPLQITGALFMGAATVGVGSTITFTVRVMPLAQPNSFGVMV